MCGIAGIVCFDGSIGRADLARIGTAMADAVAHRGPDGKGVWGDDMAALAHRRLAVVDLTASGAQPMISTDERWIISYNGELYNAHDLRRELAHLKIRWRGTSDTEVILEAVAAWGVRRAMAATNGMFAIALWDRRDRNLHLVRDRMGIKPLYVKVDRKQAVFGSELKALAVMPGVLDAIDEEALAGFLRFAYVPTPRSIWRGVSKIEPGEIRSVDAQGRVTSQRFWSVVDAARKGLAEPFAGTLADAENELDALLRDAVARQMVSDVPLGAFLSGGIDSSCVVAAMCQAGQGQVRTFSIGFGERTFNEAQHAAAVASHLGTQHTELTVTAADALNVVPRIPEIYDEPFADSSQIPTLLISELTRKHVTVALSGDGGDELFAGYNRYRLAARWGAWLTRCPMALRVAAAGILLRLPVEATDRILNRLPGLPPQAADKLMKIAEVLPLDSRGIYRRLVSQIANVSNLIPGRHEPRWQIDGDPLEGADNIERMQLLDMLTYLPDDILAKVDRASMAPALELRVPLLDHRLVEFSWRLPREMKIQGSTGKFLLRRVLDRYVPAALLDRPKQGFGIPLGAWLRGPLRDWGEDLLDPGKFGSNIAMLPVRQMWDAHQSGHRNFAYGLWNILVFEAWRRHWSTRVAYGARIAPN